MEIAIYTDHASSVPRIPEDDIHISSNNRSNELIIIMDMEQMGKLLNELESAGS